ncbi:serine carboxypeptidase [Trametes versicolor FP-101664 SS1]|uniref:serine carboxypeptidase n=1 Tax=Trametes versicolor (strain FP-101664) TaxID=717944 RepID=UPI0004622ACB|nr:serine carboxypeptidase [Trametes versicolor FP-101664 SS1]EIW56060.1 serine carboxypeptidase [Trametes versicolor FP-101664 SS1]
MAYSLAAFFGLALTAVVTVSGAVSGQHLSQPLPWPVLSVQDSNPTTPYTEYNAGMFTPVGELGALTASEFTTLAHPAFPRHSVRVKQSHFCDESVRAYTGYIDVEARHLFFYFFESRGDPDTDDVVFWTNGGPGSSSSYGLFMELGPCRINGPNATVPFEYSWTKHANVFFIDQPVGVGFSYAEYGESVDNTIDASKDIAAFIAIFFEHFTKFKGRPLHLAGESYAGRYLPVYASAIYDQNAKLVERGVAPVNLSSVMIGNGGTEWLSLILSWYDARCADPIYPPVDDIATCVYLKQLVPRCQKRMQAACIDQFDRIDCAAASNFCWQLGDVYVGENPTRNPYDRARPCSGAPDGCYPEISDIQSYLSLPAVQDAIGVDPAVRGNFSINSWRVSLEFIAGLDLYSYRADHYLAALLERGVRVLVYVGSNDWVANWIGNDRMTRSLEWTGNGAFRAQPLREWFVDGVAAGLTRSGGGLTFATIADAGHLAPYDQPVRSLALANRWLAREEL